LEKKFRAGIFKAMHPEVGGEGQKIEFYGVME